MTATGRAGMAELARLLAVALGALVAMALPSGAAECRRIEHDGQGYVLCEVPAEQEPALRLFQDGPDGAPLRNFANVRRSLAPGETLSFAMNAGMFHADYRPVGLLVVEGRELSPLVTGASHDNFGMLPNGVFCSGGARPFQVIESRAFAEARPDCRLATQSGPMLVVDGEDLDEMLGNLLDNALAHARARVVIEATGDGREVLIRIADDGPGLSPAEIATVRQPGRRLDESQPGHGFGLPITAEIAELYGGRLELGRAPEGGLEARLVLLAGPGAANDRARPS